MANAVGTIRKIKNDFLTCGICLENLSKPKCLACLHKFCEGCLEAYVVKEAVNLGQKFQCPYRCREKTVLPKNRIQGLKTDFTLQGLIDYLHQREAEESMKQKAKEGKVSGLYTDLEVVPSDNDLQNLYDALWKSEGGKRPPTSGAKPYTNLESLFDTYDYVDGVPRQEDQGEARPPVVPRRKAASESEREPPAIPPRRWEQQDFNRSSSETSHKRLYPVLPKSKSVDSAELNRGEPPLRASAPPEFDLQHASPFNVSPSQHKSSSPLTSPPAYNPYLTINSQNSTSDGNGMTPLIEDVELNPKAHRSPKTFMEKMKDKFRIDLSKTTPRPANRTETYPTDSNRTDVNRIGANTKLESDDYETMMKLAKEKSLRDNTPVRKETFSKYQPAYLDEEEAYTIAKDESRWHHVHKINAEFEGADNYIMYSLGKQLSEEESRQDANFIKINLEDLTKAADIDKLSARQLVHILATNNVDYNQSAKKYALAAEVTKLWQRHKVQSRPLPNTPHVYDNRSSKTKEQTIVKSGDIPDQSTQESVRSSQNASPQSTASRPVRSAKYMKLPEIPPEEKPANKSPVSTERRSSPFLAMPISDRPLPDTPSNERPVISSIDRRSMSSERYVDRTTIERNEESRDIIDLSATSPIASMVRRKTPAATATPSGGRKFEQYEQVKSPEFHDYLKLAREKSPSSEEVVPVADPGSEPDIHEVTSYKDPVASLAEALRGSLLARQVSNSKQNICFECKKAIEKGMLHTTVKGNNYHINCFRCKSCQQTIDGTSYDEPSFPSCVTCYEKYSSKRCSKCRKIAYHSVSWDGKTFHKECFTCTRCDKKFQSEKVYKQGGNPYCTKCYTEVFAQNCLRCRRPILGASTKISMDRVYHRDCLTCVSCDTPLSGMRMYSKGKGDDVTCNACYK